MARSTHCVWASGRVPDDKEVRPMAEQNSSPHGQGAKERMKMVLKPNSSFKGLPLVTHRPPMRLHLAKDPPPAKSTDLHTSLSLTRDL